MALLGKAFEVPRLKSKDLIFLSRTFSVQDNLDFRKKLKQNDQFLRDNQKVPTAPRPAPINLTLLYYRTIVSFKYYAIFAILLRGLKLRSHTAIFTRASKLTRLKFRFTLAMKAVAHSDFIHANFSCESRVHVTVSR